MYIYKSPKVVNEYKFDIRTIIRVPQKLTFNTSKVGLWVYSGIKVASPTYEE